MAPPTTLKDLWQQELDDAQSVLDADKSELASALADRDTARATLRAALARVGSDRKAIDALWKAMPEAGADGALSAAAEHDLETIRADMVSLMGDEAAAVGAGEAVTRLEARITRIQARVQEDARRVSGAQASMDQATTDDARRSAWAAAARSAPLSDVPGAAHDFIGGSEYGDAETRVQGAIPEHLRQVAGARADLERTRLRLARELSAFVVTKIQSHVETTGGLAGKVERGKLGLAAAEAALADFSLRGEARLSRAKALIAAVDPAVSPAATTEIGHAPPNAAATATAYQEALQAQADVEQRWLALRKSTIQCDVEPTPARKSAVTQAQSRLDDARHARDTKVNALKPHLAEFRAWEAAVPATAWQAFNDFNEQTAVLNDLHAIDAAGLADAVEAAEQALVSALLDALPAERGGPPGAPPPPPRRSTPTKRLSRERSRAGCSRPWVARAMCRVWTATELKGDASVDHDQR